jgi:hypothetical protein
VKSDNIPVFVSGHFKLPSGVQAHLVDVEVIYLCHYAFVFLHVTKHIQNKPAQTAINRGIVVEIGGNFTARNSCASSRKKSKGFISFMFSHLGTKRFKKHGSKLGTVPMKSHEYLKLVG